MYTYTKTRTCLTYIEKGFLMVSKQASKLLSVVCAFVVWFLMHSSGLATSLLVPVAEPLGIAKLAKMTLAC